MKNRYIILTTSLFILIYFSLSLGNSTINIFNMTKQESNIILLLRAPRVIFGLLCGMGLALCGSIMQGITRNPMASPFTLGVSSSAAFGAAVAIVFLNDNPITVMLGAFLSTILCATIVFVCALKKDMESLTMIIIGIALNYLFTALTSTLQYIASDDKISAIVRWTFGSLNGVEWTNVWLLLIILAPILIFTQRKAWILNLICNCDDDYSLSLGVNPSKERLFLGFSALLLTSVIISTCGIIGFVGLAAPYISKRIVGDNHRYLLTYSMLVGGVLILISDILGRTLFSPIIIPIGIILSYIGVPILINLILKRGEK
ncbi:MAG: FecCD family ABC transporter permease [Cetobacterium sp.]|uniref:FecCD family ABC transporter permease n=1 Tax=Cetobacterium sp. TaxID=2071632 RepID=UPI003EE724F9